jgi:hypothetical protein
VTAVWAVLPVPEPPAVEPGDGWLPGVSFVLPEVVPGVDDGAVFGADARGSPSSVGPQPAAMIENTKRATRAMEILFIPGFNDSSMASVDSKRIVADVPGAHKVHLPRRQGVIPYHVDSHFAVLYVNMVSGIVTLIPSS